MTRGVEPLFDEIVPLVLERRGGFDLSPHAQEHRARIDREARAGARASAARSTLACDAEQSHAGAALGAGDRDAIDHRLDDAGAGAERSATSSGRDILALPAEGVADAVDEIVEALRVEAHQVAACAYQASPGANTSRRIFFSVSAALV